METVLLAIHVVCSILLVGAILLQSGKGGGLAAGFGGASAGTQMFGGAGAGGFMSKATIVLAAIFMTTSLTLAYLSSQPRSAMSLEGPGAVGNQEDEIVEPGGAAGNESAPVDDQADDQGAGSAVPTDDTPAEPNQPALGEPAAPAEGAGQPGPSTDDEDELGSPTPDEGRVDPADEGSTVAPAAGSGDGE